MYDLSQTSFIIHYRTDCEDRKRNLITILGFLNTQIRCADIVVVNDDITRDPVMDVVGDVYPNINILFFNNGGEFKKSTCFNLAAQTTSSEVLCFYDVDVLIPPTQLQEAQRMIIMGEADHVYPFNGVFVDFNPKQFTGLLTNYDFTEIHRVVVPTLNYRTNQIHIKALHSPGGCSMISRTAFDNINGFDESFKGWGFEDTDFRQRSSQSNNSVKYLPSDNYLYHIHHATHNDIIRSKQPHYNENRNTFYRNQNVDR